MADNEWDMPHDTVEATISHDARPPEADRAPTFEISSNVGFEGRPSSITVDCDQVDRVEVRDGKGQVVFKSDHSDVAEFLRLLGRYMRGEES